MRTLKKLIRLIKGCPFLQRLVQQWVILPSDSLEGWQKFVTSVFKLVQCVELFLSFSNRLLLVVLHTCQINVVARRARWSSNCRCLKRLLRLCWRSGLWGERRQLCFRVRYVTVIGASLLDRVDQSDVLRIVSSSVRELMWTDDFYFKGRLVAQEIIIWARLFFLRWVLFCWQHFSVKSFRLCCVLVVGESFL